MLQSLKNPLDAFFSARQAFRKARVRARLEARHSLLTARQDLLNHRIVNLENVLSQLHGSDGDGSNGGGGGTLNPIAGDAFDESG